MNESLRCFINFICNLLIPIYTIRHNLNLILNVKTIWISLFYTQKHACNSYLSNPFSHPPLFFDITELWIYETYIYSNIKQINRLEPNIILN